MKSRGGFLGCMRAVRWNSLACWGLDEHCNSRTNCPYGGRLYGSDSAQKRLEAEMKIVRTAKAAGGTIALNSKQQPAELYLYSQLHP